MYHHYLLTRTRNVFLVFSLLTIFSCNAQNSIQLTEKDIIPVPKSVISSEDGFSFSENSAVLYNDESLEFSVEFFKNEVRNNTGLAISSEINSDTASEGIHFQLIDAIKGEAYRLTIKKERILLEAGTSEGIFRGVQTLLQLIPKKKQDTSILNSWSLPALIINDFPEYAYRGSMLDVSRHFFTVEQVKKYIDYLAAYKFNYFHIHLTDDQGWRIEIKSWPKLTEIGARTEVDGGEGGFYTQEDYREIVKYARERFITVVPEIDMPGHTNAALTSYPELNCDGKAPELYTGTKVGFSSFCIEKEVTYTFVEDVIRELAAITPGPYIHIGGDESLSTEEEDYISFIARVQDIVYENGKTPIGWDEIQHAPLKSETLVQFWGKEKNAIEAVKKGAKLIMSPSTKAYMDMKYDSLTKLGLNWAGYIDVETGYNWNPDEILTGVTRKDILGVEAPLWTETIEDMAAIEYMVFPRLMGYAEIGWSAKKDRNWEAYKKRLKKHLEILDVRGVNFYNSEEVLDEK
ncbi:beta-N-acetylhexosaminidase [Galbibacter mesophilus]|uniref:beta-N-acetylhexosaminidase n=1 Tax=Galbibacter mesophilus TaxID=379069 RepID=UPI00192031EB|nr:beta-N-acetylhexosaminidase [Galbibacter mesophilus]MCM5664426.1 beta-N-acetylhexosaminidase [Galbibacter mesophilus]